MAGRDFLRIHPTLIEEPKQHIINLSKCLFIIISVTPIRNSQSNRSVSEETDLPVDLIELSNLIDFLTSLPINVPNQNIKKFINPENSDDIYYEILKATRKEDIENIVIFYQGFGYVYNSKFYLLLDENFVNDSSNYIRVDEISNIVKSKKNLNTILFLDCSYAALSFLDFDSDNFVIITSCDKDENAHFEFDEDSNKQASIFSSALIETLISAINSDKEYLNLSDIFLAVRTRVIQIIDRMPGNKIKQLPRINSRNLTQYFQFITNSGTKISESKNHTGATERKIDNNKKISIEEVKKLIAKDRLREVIESLQSLDLNLDTQQEKEIIMYKNRFINNESSKRLEIISYEEYQLRYRKIVENLLDFLSDLEMYNE